MLRPEEYPRQAPAPASSSGGGKRFGLLLSGRIGGGDDKRRSGQPPRVDQMTDPGERSREKKRIFGNIKDSLNSVTVGKKIETERKMVDLSGRDAFLSQPGPLYKHNMRVSSPLGKSSPLEHLGVQTEDDFELLDGDPPPHSGKEEEEAEQRRQLQHHQQHLLVSRRQLEDWRSRLLLAESEAAEVEAVAREMGELLSSSSSATTSVAMDALELEPEQD